MMINKIQNKDDFHEFQTTALEYMKSVFSSTSEEMQDLILTVTWGLLMKMKVEEEKARADKAEADLQKAKALIAELQKKASSQQ